MTLNNVVKQLRAVEDGIPVPKYETLHVRVVENPMIVAFVRMAGESRPWGIAFSRLDDKTPTVLTAGDGRNRKEVAEIVSEFAQVLLDYCRAEGYSFDPITKESHTSDEIPQIWVPDDRHIEMFHHLEYAYWRSRTSDDRTDVNTTLARLAGWLFREYNRRGQQFVIDAAKTMRESYVFPTDTSSLGSLRASIAWFQEHDSLPEKRIAVREAATVRVSTTLDPLLDLKVFEPLIDERAKLLRADKPIKEINAKIHAALEPELISRWDAVIEAYKILANDTRRENLGVERLVANSLARYWDQFQRIELRLQDAEQGPVFTPHPETDFHGSAAAAAYYKSAEAETAYLATLIHDDTELQAESLASGHSFLGKVVDISDIGVDRKTVAIWQLEVDSTELLRLREGDSFSILGNMKSEFKVREVEILTEDTLSVVGEWISPKKAQLLDNPSSKPLDMSWINDRVLFVPNNSSQFEAMRSRAVWEASKGVGAWLTHGKAPVSVVENIIDDITQLQD